jgi:hypothetical protein
MKLTEAVNEALIQEMAIWSEDKKRLKNIIKQHAFLMKHINDLAEKMDTEIQRGYAHDWSALTKGRQKGDFFTLSFGPDPIYNFHAAVMSLLPEYPDELVAARRELEVWKYFEHDELLVSFWNRLKRLWAGYWGELGGDISKVKKILGKKDVW